MIKLILFRQNKNKPMPEMYRRSISYYDATFLLHGQMSYRINDHLLSMKDGDVILIPSGAQRQRDPLSECHYFSFNFITDHPLDLPVLMPGVLSSAIRLLLLGCGEISSKTGEDDPRLSLVLSAILLQLREELRNQSVPPLVKVIKQFVAEHIHQPITREMIAAATFFSPAYCSAVFKKQTGHSLLDYVLEEKINLAKESIYEGVALSTVAATLGFSDYNYFSRVFKKRTGQSPLQYKRSIFG